MLRKTNQKFTGRKEHKKRRKISWFFLLFLRCFLPVNFWFVFLNIFFFTIFSFVLQERLYTPRTGHSVLSTSGSTAACSLFRMTCIVPYSKHWEYHEHICMQLGLIFSLHLFCPVYELLPVTMRQHIFSPHWWVLIFLMLSTN